MVTTVEPTNGLPQVGQLDLDRGLLARLVLCLRRLDRDVEHALLRRHDDLAHLVVDLAAGDRQRLDEEVGHVAWDDADLLDRALALQRTTLGGRYTPLVGRTNSSTVPSPGWC